MNAGRRPGALQRGGRGSAYSPDVNAEFNWWLLIVGLVVGAGLVWLVVADSRRREVDVTELEREGEARWIAETMTDAGREVDEADVLDVLRLHAAYLAAAPPDQSFDDIPDVPAEADEAGADARPGPGRWITRDRAPEGRADEGRADDERRWVAVPETPPESESTVSRR
jgi:hypothetical protein